MIEATKERKAIAESNNLIANFMKGEVQPETWNWNYHDSWEWLMPVVEKIEGTEVDGHYYDVRIGTTTTVIVDDTFNLCFEPTETISGTKLEKTYEVVTEFINELNSNR